jgi:Nucleosome assembly protein (NAP).
MMNDHDPARTECTPINWKEGHNLFLQTVTKKQSNKKTGITRTVTKTVEGETFFNFFRSIDPKVPSQNEDEVLFSYCHLNL